MKELQVLQSLAEEVEAEGGLIVAISADPVEDAHRMVTKLGFTFPVLCDPEVKAIRAFGLYYREPLMRKDLARPATYFVNADGTLAHVIQTPDYRERLTAEQVRKGFALTR